MPAWSWEYYKLVKDTQDKAGRLYDHAGTRVIKDFWVSLFFPELLC